MKLTAIDLFCGCGGMTAGLIDAGVDVVAAFDNWDVAIGTYHRNVGDHATTLDLSDTKSAIYQVSRINVDIIAGGPPCQDFSTAGRRVEGSKADLTKCFGEIVAACLPRYFLMENVPQVRLSESYKVTRKCLKRAGYSITETVLDASQCGVPQCRKRFFAFGSLEPRETSVFQDSLMDRLSDKKMTIKDYLGDLIDIEHYYRHPRNYSRRSVFSVNEPSPTIRGVNRPVPPGYAGNHLDSAPPCTVRPLTSLERSQIQTFPTDWDWNARDRNSDAELQIGNAVPVNLARFVASGILDAARN